MHRHQARRRLLVTASLVIALIALGLGPATGAPADEGPGRTASVWLPYWDMGSALATVTANSDLFTTASPFWYDVTRCDRIARQRGAGSARVVRALRAKKMAVVPTLTASGLTPRRAVGCLGDEASRSRHVRMLVGLLRRQGFDGLDIDYEHLALTRRPAVARKVRRAYSAFVRDLCGALDGVGRTCSITVMARTSDRVRPEGGRLSSGVFDYAAVCEAASTVRVMAYDQHNRYTRPGPVAGLPWVRRVVGYVTSHCAEPATVSLGIPLYGRDWGGRSFGTLTGDEGFRLAARVGARVRFDSERGEYTFSYRSGGRRHTVWMSGPRSAAVRSRLARESGLAGAAYWAAGQQPAGTWAAVRRNG